MIVTESVSVAGVRLVYDTAGVGDPPMIFIHGWCCDRSFFAPQFAHLAAGRPVLVGHSLGALVGLVCAARGRDIGALVMVDPAPITNEKAKKVFRESAGAVAADEDGS